MSDQGKVVAKVTEMEAEVLKNSTNMILAIDDTIENLLEKKSEEIKNRRNWWSNVYKQYGLDENGKYNFNQRTGEILELSEESDS